jgi:hypothetical protein
MECLECGYATKRASQYQRHLKSNKHLAITGNACVCGNVYANLKNLRRHEKTCSWNKPKLDAVVIQLAQEQTNFFKQQQLLEKERAERDERLASEHASEINRLVAELAARPSTVLNMNNNTNCSFNLALFLNERCKSAPTIEQFMDRIPLHMDSSIEIGRYFLDNLAKCAIEERPIHCTDVKRGKLAVKHGESWEQDTTKPLIDHNLNLLRVRFIKHLSEVWCVENPKFAEDGPLCDEYDRLYAMTCKDVDEKFHRHLATTTVIPKD